MGQSFVVRRTGLGFSLLAASLVLLAPEEGHAQSCTRDTDCPGQLVCEGGTCAPEGGAAAQPPVAPAPVPGPAPAAPPATGAPPPAGYQPAPGTPPPGYQGGQGYPPPGYQGGQGYPPPGYQGGYAPVPPPPPEDETVHFHDGFYLRMGIGVGFLKSTTTVDGADGEVEITGTGPALEFALGGTPTPGFVIGGAISGVSVSEPDVKFGDYSGTAEDTTFTQSNVGVFVDVYPNPEQGFHIQGLLAYGIASVQSEGGEDDDDEDATGPVAELGIGYEGWVGEQWGIGVLGRLTVGKLKPTEGDDADEVDISIFTPAILFTATYH